MMVIIMTILGYTNGAYIFLLAHGSGIAAHGAPKD